MDNKIPEEKGIKDLFVTPADVQAGQAIRDTIKHGPIRDVDDQPTKLDKSLDHINKRTGDLLRGNQMNTASIISRAKNSILQFPVYMTASIGFSTAQVISRSFERVYATLVQTVLAQNPEINEDEVNNMRFLRHFHSNIKEPSSASIGDRIKRSFREAHEELYNKFYDPIDGWDQLMQESIFYSTQINDDIFVEFKVIPCTDKNLILESQRLSNEPLSGLSYLKENEEKSSLKDRLAELNQKGKAQRRSNYTNDSWKRLQTYLYNSDAILRGKKAATDEDIKIYINGLNAMISKDAKIGDQGQNVSVPRLIKDSDVKKLNQMHPYTIEATFNVRGTHGYFRQVSFIIGIKAVMHIISPTDLSGELRDLIMGKEKSLQKVRYKTGEINTAEYLFNKQQLKRDAAKDIDRDKRWINTLKRLSDLSDANLHGSLWKRVVGNMTGSTPIPNGTMVLTQTDVTAITNKSGIDLSQVNNAITLAKSLFLIGICIVDETEETIKILFPDSDTTWDVQSLGALGAEVSKIDNNALMNELNRKINR